MTGFAKHLELLRSGHFGEMPQHFMERRDPMDYLIFWVLDGRGFVETEGRRFEARTGHLFTFQPHERHRYGSDPQAPWELLWMHFQGGLAADFANAIRQHGGACVDFGIDPALRDRWLELVIFYESVPTGIGVREHAGLASLLGLLLHRLQRPPTLPSRGPTFDVAGLQSFIQQRYREPITLEDLARQARLSPTHFARVFKKEFKISPMGYVIQKRIALACSLLTETAMPMKEISAAVGYPDQYYFSRLFKKMTGVNPTTYRQRRRTG